MEAEWMKSISDTTICNVFYFYWVAGVLVAIYNFVTGVTLFNTITKGTLARIGAVLFLLAVTVFTIVVSAFTYMICNRALLEPAQKKVDA